MTKFYFLLSGFLFGIIFTLIVVPFYKEAPCKLSRDAELILKMVEKDTTIQKVFLDYEFRRRVQRMDKFQRP